MIICIGKRWPYWCVEYFKIFMLPNISITFPGRHDCHSGGVRMRQDRDLAVAVQVLQLWRHHLRGVRGARQRDERGAAGLSPAHRRDWRQGREGGQSLLWAVFRIHDILVWIRIRGCMPLRLWLMDPDTDSDPDPAIFVIDLQEPTKN